MARERVPFAVGPRDARARCNEAREEVAVTDHSNMRWWIDFRALRDYTPHRDYRVDVPLELVVRRCDRPGSREVPHAVADRVSTVEGLAAAVGIKRPLA